MELRERSIRERLADELRAEMSRQHIRSARQMAGLIDRPHVTVSSWINGKTPIDPDALEAMCNVLGMTTPDLYAAAQRNGGWTIKMPAVRERPTRLTGAADRQKGVNASTNSRLTKVSTRECVTTTRRRDAHRSVGCLPAAA